MSTPELFLTTVTLGLVYLRFASVAGGLSVCLLPTDGDPGVSHPHKTHVHRTHPRYLFLGQWRKPECDALSPAGPCHRSREPRARTRHTAAAEGHVLTPVSCHILPPQLCFPVSLCLSWLRSVYPLMKWLPSCPGLRAAPGEWKSLIEWRTLRNTLKCQAGPSPVWF